MAARERPEQRAGDAAEERRGHTHAARAYPIRMRRAIARPESRRALCSLGRGQRERTGATGNEDLLTTGEWRERRGNSAGQDSAQPVADELLM